MRVLLALVETLGVVGLLFLGVSLIASLVDGTVANIGVSGHDAGCLVGEVGFQEYVYC